MLLIVAVIAVFVAMFSSTFHWGMRLKRDSEELRDLIIEERKAEQANHQPGTPTEAEPKQSSD